MEQWLQKLIEDIVEFNPITIAILACLVFGGILVLVLVKSRWTTNMLAMGALVVALSFILSFMAIAKMPQGGSVTLASGLPIMLYAYMFGPIAGITAGVVHGLLQLIQGAFIVHPAQFLLDYIFPFAILGVSGWFVKRFTLGTIVANIGRFVMHFLSGAIFWGMYAGEGQSVWEYSLIYNASYMIPELIITAVLAFIIMKSPVRKSLEKYKAK